MDFVGLTNLIWHCLLCGVSKIMRKRLGKRKLYENTLRLNGKKCRESFEGVWYDMGHNYTMDTRNGKKVTENKHLD